MMIGTRWVVCYTCGTEKKGRFCPDYMFSDVWRGKECTLARGTELPAGKLNHSQVLGL